MATQRLPKIFQQLTPKRLIWPALIGLVVIVLLFRKEFDVDSFLQIPWTFMSFFWIFIALLLLLLRDLAYAYRIRLLTDGWINWKQALKVVYLWEFASAATPSSAGGTPMAIYLLTKEKITAGKSTAIVVLTIFIDELFFLLAVPLGYLLYRSNLLMPDAPQNNDLVNTGILHGLQLWFIVAYAVVFLYTALLAYGLFINPQGVKRFLHRVFSFRFLKRFRKSAIVIGTDIIIASDEMKKNTFWFWFKSFAATAISWSARLLLLNALLLAFSIHPDHLLLYFRQIIMWLIALVSPTPGGSGLAELSFTAFLSDLTPSGLIAAIILIWRFLTYYIYLFIGILLLQYWVSEKFLPRRKRGNASENE